MNDIRKKYIDNFLNSITTDEMDHLIDLLIYDGYIGRAEFDFHNNSNSSFYELDFIKALVRIKEKYLTISKEDYDKIIGISKKV